MEVHIKILEGNHNPLDILEDNLEDESKNNIVDWSSAPIYDDYFDDIHEINQTKALEKRRN